MKKILIGLLLISSFIVAADTAKYTNKDFITLKGHADPGVDVEIFVNDRKVDTIKSDEQGDWYAESIPLPKDGKNLVHAIAKTFDGFKSKTSTKLTVIVDKDPPKIYQLIVTPKLVKPGELLNVSLKTDKDVSKVTAMMPDNSTIELTPAKDDWVGQWNVPKLIAGGTYRLMLIVMDKAGNITQQNSEDIEIDAISSLTITTPEEGAIIYDELVNVKGMARNSNYVILNEEKMPVQDDGQFNGYAKVPKPGKNRISVRAFDPAGNQLEASLNLVRLITYPDIKTHWAKKEIEYLATLGYVQAYPDSNVFAPEAPISRAELATLLVRTKQFPLTYVGLQKPTFKDVRENYWANGYIETASRYGLVVGYPGGLYRPTNPVIRAEGAAMFTRFANVPVLKTGQAADIDVGPKHWAGGYIAAFKNAGLEPSEWTKARRFFPDRPLTRAEVCAILARIPEISKEIENLINRKPQYGDADQTNVSLDQTPPPGAVENNSALVVGLVSPREVLAGNDLNLAVATLVKMKQVNATMPDGSQVPLRLNNITDLWEVNWKVPANFKPGENRIAIDATGFNDRKYSSASNAFMVVTAGDAVKAQSLPEQPVRVDMPPETVLPQSTEMIYPEYSEKPRSFEPAPAETQKMVSETLPANPTVGGELTRAKMTEILAKYGKLRQAKVNAAPAKDVPLNHPQVRSIKSAIVTGLMPNLKPGYFYPEKALTRAEAVAILKKAKIPAEEFDNILGKSVK